MSKALEAEQLRINQARLAGYSITAEQEAAALKAIRESSAYKEADAKKTKAYTEDAGTKMLDQARQQYAVLQQQSAMIGTQADGSKALGAEAKKLIELEQMLADIKGKQTLTADQKSILAMAELNLAQQKRNAGLEKEVALRKQATEETQKLATFQQAVNDKLAQDQQGLDNALSGMGLGSEGRKRLQDDLKIQQDYQKQIQQLQRDFQNGKITKDLYDKETAILDEALASRLVKQEAYYRDLDALQSDWTLGANAAWQDYVSEAGNIAGQTKDLFGNAFQSMEDDLVDFARGGKLSFKSFADSVIDDLLRIIAKTQIITPLLNAVFGGSGGGGASSFGGAVGSMFGGNGGDSNGWGGMVSLGKNLYSAWSNLTGVGSSIASGYASGGFSGAISGGASYYGNMLSSISSTLSNGFTSLASTITGTAAVQTAAIIGAEGVTSAALTGAVSQGATAIGAQFTTGVATTSAATYAAAEAGAAATAASLGGQISAAVSSAAAMWPLAVLMGMYQSGKLYDAGVRPDAGEIMDSGGKTALGKVVMAPGAAMSGFFEAQDKVLGKVVGGKWAAILSGSTLHQAVTKYVGEKLFGGAWQTKNSGISLGVEDGQLEAQQFVDQKKKGGLFSSSKKRTRYSALDAQTAESMAAVYDATEQGVIALVSRIGISANEGTFDGLNIAKSKLSTKGKTGDEIQKLISDWFGSASDQMVSFLDGGTGGFGYSFAELAQRIASFETFNSTLDTLNIAVLGLSPHSMELANSLIAAAGGMEAFQTATNTYYDNFFSEAEKADDTLAAVTKQFAAMGVTLPGTRDAYRDMVEALDMTTASGQSMFMTLTGLAGNAAQAYSILEQRAGAAAESAAAAADAATAAAKELADALKEALMSSVSSAMSAVQRAISAQQKAATDAYNATTASLNDRVNTATENVAGLTAVGNDLSAALKELRGDSDDAVKMLRVQAQATLQSALVKARSGGSLSGLAGLEDALDTVSNNNTDLYGSLEDFARDQGRTANVVAELNGINGKQLTASEKSLKGLETQIELAKKAYDAQMTSFDSQLAFAQSQLDALNGVDTSVLSVAAAVQQMNAAVVAALAGQAAGAAMKNTTDNNVALLESVYQAVLGRGLDGNGLATWTAALANGSVTYENLVQTIATGGRLNGEAVKIPGYANGGEYGGGLRLVGERGPELEVTGPSRIYNASQTAAMLSGGGQDTANEVRQLRAELKSALFAIAKNTLKSARNTELLPQKLEQELFA
jgi:lambda family phage tail tape measure protein